jgi:hypothetical protein
VELMNNNAFVQKIELLSKDAEEALVHITDEIYECAAFCQPCNKSLGDVIEEPLYAFNSEGLVLDTIQENLYIKSSNNNLGYEICAKVLNVENNLLQVGAILIEPDTCLPGGLKVGDYLKLTCGRLDLF